jgi:hypothetical protein
MRLKCGTAYTQLYKKSSQLPLNYLVFTCKHENTFEYICEMHVEELLQSLPPPPKKKELENHMF